MKVKKVLRIAWLILLLLLACCGVGMPPPTRTKDFENEVKIEHIEKKRDEEVSEADTQQEVD